MPAQNGDEVGLIPRRAASARIKLYRVDMLPRFSQSIALLVSLPLYALSALSGCSTIHPAHAEGDVHWTYDGETGRAELKISTMVWERGWPRVTELP